MKLTEKNKPTNDPVLLFLRRQVAEMRALVERKEYEYLMSKTDRQWLDGISTRLDKKTKLMNGGQ